MSSRRAKIIALSVGNALATVITIGVTMAMARVLDKQDLAAFRQTLLAYATVVPILGLGIGQGMYYFLPVEKSRIRGRVLDGIGVTAAMGLLFAAFIALGGNQLLAQRFSNPKVAQMLLWMIPYAIIVTPSELASSVLVARDRVKLSATFGVFRQLLIGIATVVPLLVWETAEASLIGNVVASLLMALVALGLMIRSTPADSMRPTFGGSSQLVQFTVPLALAGMIATISLQLDKLIVGFLCTPEEFAVYALGAMEIPLVGMVTGAITAVMLVDMRRAIDSGDPLEALRLFRMVAEKSSYIILPVMLFLMVTAETLMQYLYGSDYVDSAIPFRVYLLLLPIRTVVFGSLIIALGQSRFILYRSAIGLAINAVLSVLLVLGIGPWGAVLATVATVYLWAVPASVHLLARKLGVGLMSVMPLREMGRVCIAVSPLVAISLLAKMLIHNIHLEFFLTALAFAVYLLFYWNHRLYSLSMVGGRIVRGAPAQF